MILKRLRTCPCGQPAVVATFPHWWVCADHVGAEGFSGREPFYGHGAPCPSGEQKGWNQNIDSGEITRYFCLHRRH